MGKKTDIEKDNTRTRKIVGGNIRRLRTARGWTQEELAFRGGLAPAHLGRIERGLQDPGLGTLDALALALEVPLAELVRDSARQSLLSLGAVEYAQELAALPPNTCDSILRVIDQVLCLVRDVKKQ